MQPLPPKARAYAWISTFLLWLFALTIERVELRPGLSYSITEWLISYPDHFMRRGLRGSLLNTVAGAHAKQAAIAVAALLTMAFMAVWVFTLFRWLWENARQWIPLALLAPAGAFMYLNALEAQNRFDLFLLLLTAAHLEVSLRAKDDKGYFVSALLLFGLSGTFAVFCHEGFALLCLPINLVMTVRRLRGFDFRAALIYLAPVMATVACVLSPATAADATAMAAKLGVTDDDSSPVGALHWGLSRDLSFVGERLGHSGLLIVAIAVFVGIQVAILRKLVNGSAVTEEGGKIVAGSTVWRDYLLIPAAFTLPLYLVGVDYGRWVAIPLIGFTLCLARTMAAGPLKAPPVLARVVLLAVFVIAALPVHLADEVTLDSFHSRLGGAILRLAHKA